MYHTVAIISFEWSEFITTQNNGWIQPAVYLSILSSITISIQVFNIDGSADGEYCLYMSHFSISCIYHYGHARIKIFYLLLPLHVYLSSIHITLNLISSITTVCFIFCVI